MDNLQEPTWMMWPWWVKIPTEDFTDETLAIDDTQGDEVRGGDWGAGDGGWQGCRWGDQHVTLKTDLTDVYFEEHPKAPQKQAP